MEVASVLEAFTSSGIEPHGVGYGWCWCCLGCCLGNYIVGEGDQNDREKDHCGHWREVEGAVRVWKSGMKRGEKERSKRELLN